MAKQALFFFKLDNYKIAFQINAITLVVFVGLSIILGVYFFNETRSRQLQEDFFASDKAYKLTSSIEYRFFNARRAEKDYILRLNTKYIDKHKNNSENIHGEIAELRVLLDNPEDKEALARINDAYTAYEEQFDLVTDLLTQKGLTEEDGLRGKLRKAVHGVESKLKEYNEADLMVIMLMMRRHEKDFLLRKNAKYIDRMGLRHAEFEQLIALSSIPEAERKGILSLMSTYQSDFKKLAELDLKAVTEISALSKLFAQAEPLMHALYEQIKAENERLTEASESLKERTFWIILSVILGVLLATVTLAVLISRKISQPVQGINNVMIQLSDDNYDVDVPGQDRKDEVGQMARSVNIFKENGIEMKRLEEEQRRAQDVQIQRAKTLEVLTDEFESSVSELLEILSSATTELNATAQSMTSIAENTSEQSNAMSSASQSTYENIQTVASASEELSASIREISQQVSGASKATESAVHDVERATSQVESLLEASEQIGDVVKIIQDIAEQTNLLALNATIESARAGEAGKGFAVVASEVKSLAQETAKATERIAEQVSSVQGETSGAVDAIRDIEVKIKDVSEVASSIAAAIEEQNAATAEISRTTQVSEDNVQELSGNVSNVNMAAESTGKAASEVLSASTNLAQRTEMLKGQVAKFLADVKAA
jgi:methyl-accepting chemotaxis protein